MPGWTYTWLGASDTLAHGPGSQLSFIADSAGIFSIGLVVTDSATGCGGVDASLANLRVSAPPAFPTISVNASLPYCEGPAYMLSAQQTASYLSWNTGVVGPQITAILPGIYRVRAVDSLGCISADSITIHPAPNVDFFLSGCYEVCSEGPPFVITGVPGQFSGYQWILDGNTVASGSGAVQDLGIQGSGAYQLSLTTFNGCSDTTEDLDLTVIDCNECQTNLEVEGVKCYTLEEGNQYILSFTMVDPNGWTGTFTATVGSLPVENFYSHLYTSDPNFLYLSDPQIIAMLLSGEHCIRFTVVIDADASGIDPLTCIKEWCPVLEVDCAPITSCGVEFNATDLRCIGYSGLQQQVHRLTGFLTDPNYHIANITVLTGGIQVLGYSIDANGDYAIDLTGAWDQGEHCMRLMLHNPSKNIYCELTLCYTLDTWMTQIADAGGCPMTRPAHAVNIGVPETGTLKLYPNPTEGALKIVPAGPTAYMQVWVLDMTGRALMEEKIFIKHGTGKLWMGHLSAGSYQLVLVDDASHKTHRMVLLAP